ncbi:MAG TPA: 50S ribosomal protein L33 [Patescibacteria group bacterium]|nr:50S ribosomal protein L33 [Patescibacteria group bacterium]
MPRAKNRTKFQCSECKRINYFANKNAHIKNKLELQKFCRHCRKHTMHKETK